MKIIPTCFELWVRYDWWVTAMKLSPETFCVLGSRLLGLLFAYSGHGTYGQATPRLLYSCLTGSNKLASNRQWVVSRSSTVVCLYLLGLEDQFSVTEDVDTFRSPQRDRWHPFSEISKAVTSNHVNMNSVWKSLETSCVCRWCSNSCFQRVRLQCWSVHLQFERVRPQRQNCSSSVPKLFVLSVKIVCPQHETRSSLAINMFICSAIRIWRLVAKTILSLVMNLFVCSVKSHLEVSSRDYLVASDERVRLLFVSWIRNPKKNRN